MDLFRRSNRRFYYSFQLSGENTGPLVNNRKGHQNLHPIRKKCDYEIKAIETLVSITCSTITNILQLPHSN